jgi:Holliday junction resolvasome RuvABC endonuclease subunit
MSKRFLYALDISLKNTGITIYDLDEKKFVFIDSFSTEKIYATKENKGLHLNAVKLKRITEWLWGIIQEYPPYIISIERMFSRFPTETQAIAKATGVIQCLLWDKPQYLYAPKEVKAKLIHGSATKEDVENAIKTKYDFEFKNDDESDSFAVALTFLIDKDLIEWDKPSWTEIKKLRKKVDKKKK